MNTPETDKRVWSDHSEGILYEVVEASFARRLERERDEAREILRKLLEIIPEPECHDFGHTKEERHAFLEKCPVMARYDALIAQAKEAAK